MVKSFHHIRMHRGNKVASPRREARAISTGANYERSVAIARRIIEERHESLEILAKFERAEADQASNRA